MSTRDLEDLQTFEALRPELLSLAYRMLGDAARAQDLVQEAWLRWHARDLQVESPKAFLVTVVTRLCLNELDSARVRHEEASGIRLPEPVDLEAIGMGGVESFDQISMAFLVMLERLSPPERAVLLLHEVFDFSHDEIAGLLSRTPAACRKILERARAKVSSRKKMLTASREEHERLLQAFVRATQTGDTNAVIELLATDATLLGDAGPKGVSAFGVRSLTKPLVGGARVAAFVVATSRAGAGTLTLEQRELNGRPAIVFSRAGQTFGALLLEVADGKIQTLFFQADPQRLRFLGKS